MEITGAGPGSPPGAGTAYIVRAFGRAPSSLIWSWEVGAGLDAQPLKSATAAAATPNIITLTNVLQRLAAIVPAR